METPSTRAARGLQERLGAAVDYLESCIKADLDLDEAARRSGFGRSHFMRLFQAAAGFPVGEYVRRRRLSLAAEALAAGHKVLETAIDCGYESQAAFTRAFSRAFGVTPAAYARGIRAGRRPVEVLLAFEPRLPEEVKPEEVKQVRPPALVERSGFRVVGRAIRISTVKGHALSAIPAFWADWYENRRGRPLGAADDALPYALLSLRASGHLEYVIGLEASEATPVPRGYVAVPVTGGRYAMFSATGVPPRTQPTLVVASYLLPLIDRTLRRRPGAWDVEVLRPEPGLPPGEYRCELWVPIERRKRVAGKAGAARRRKRTTARAPA